MCTYVYDPQPLLTDIVLYFIMLTEFKLKQALDVDLHNCQALSRRSNVGLSAFINNLSNEYCR